MKLIVHSDALVVTVVRYSPFETFKAGTKMGLNPTLSDGILVSVLKLTLPVLNYYMVEPEHFVPRLETKPGLSECG
jgi:hypothetical protein